MDKVQEKINELLIERAGIKDRLERNDKAIAQMLAIQQGIQIGVDQERKAQESIETIDLDEPEELQ